VAVNHPRKLWGFDSLPAHSQQTAVGRPSCVAERVTKPIRNREASVSEPYLK
jgi:hypothetical protein